MGDVNYTPRTWVVAEVVTAAEMTTEIKTPFTGIQAAWTSYACTWTATTTNPVLNNGTLVSRYNRVGKTIDVSILLTMGSTTTFGTGVWLFTLPFAMTSVRWGSAIGEAFDSSAAGVFMITASGNTASILSMRAWPAVAGAVMANVTNLVPMTWAVSDVLSMTIRGELA